MHFLRNSKGIDMSLDKPRLCRKFKKRGKRLTTYGEPCVLYAGTPLRRLPDDFKVFNEDGEDVPALGEFYVTVETFDPHHLITDVFPSS